MKQTAKEKAEELVHKFDLMQTCIEGFSLQDAKECALIGVDEILKVLEEICDDRGYDPFEAPLYTLKYFQDVKQEIINLK